MDRREFAAASAALAVAACSGDSKLSTEPPEVAAPVPPPPPPVPAEAGVIRLASVKTAVEGNLLPELIARFERDSPLKVRLTTGVRVYDLARDGKADVVISHYGHKDAEKFVLDGLGEWPRTIFSNQMALLGPPSDPAGVRDSTDLVEAFGKIAASKSPFLMNDIDGVRYLTEILWNAIGRPDRKGWLLDAEVSRDVAVAHAHKLGAYTMWGLTPFLRMGTNVLEPLVLDDPLLQRMMVSVIVKPGDVRQTNVDAARTFQSFLMAPATQAFIRTVRYPGKRQVNWAPAGRHNRTAVLPKV